jgi:hypothetical protein
VAIIQSVYRCWLNVSMLEASLRPSDNSRVFPAYCTLNLLAVSVSFTFTATRNCMMKLSCTLGMVRYGVILYRVSAQEPGSWLPASQMSAALPPAVDRKVFFYCSRLKGKKTKSRLSVSHLCNVKERDKGRGKVIPVTGPGGL